MQVLAVAVCWVLPSSSRAAKLRRCEVVPRGSGLVVLRLRGCRDLVLCGVLVSGALSEVVPLGVQLVAVWIVVVNWMVVVLVLALLVLVVQPLGFRVVVLSVLV